MALISAYCSKRTRKSAAAGMALGLDQARAALFRWLTPVASSRVRRWRSTRSLRTKSKHIAASAPASVRHSASR